MNTNLIFVYNADSSFFAKLTDFAHKIIQPSTYSCNLCKLTYTNFAMKSEWKDFVSTLPYSVKFLHKNEFAAEYPDFKDQDLPAIYIEEQFVTQLVNASELNNLDSLRDLKSLLVQKLKYHFDLKE
jgi:hypothetical protein